MRNRSLNILNNARLFGKDEETIIHRSKCKPWRCFGYHLGHWSCSLAQVSAQNGVRTSGVKWTSWSVLCESGGRAARSEFVLQVTSVFVEENGGIWRSRQVRILNRVALQEQGGKYGNVTSPLRSNSCWRLLYKQLLTMFWKKFIQQKSGLTLFDIL